MNGGECWIKADEYSLSRLLSKEDLEGLLRKGCLFFLSCLRHWHYLNR